MQTPQVRKSPAKNRKNYSRAPWSLSRGRTSPSPPAFIPKHFLQMRQEFCFVCYSSQALTTEKACKKSWLSPNLVTRKSKLEVPPLQPGFRVAVGAWIAILAADTSFFSLLPFSVKKKPSAHASATSEKQNFKIILGISNALITIHRKLFQ